jgi:TrpR-related protein YerC/YecD
MPQDRQQSIQSLCEALIEIENKEEALNFLKDLCTPQELEALSERWRVCMLLEDKILSQRKIHTLTGASLTTIGRVARFLNSENYGGYRKILTKTKIKKEKKTND